MKETETQDPNQTTESTTPDIETSKKSQLQDTHGDFYFAFPTSGDKKQAETIELILRDLNKYSPMM